MHAVIPLFAQRVKKFRVQQSSLLRIFVLFMDDIKIDKLIVSRMPK
jgi:hypothetical protein